MDIYITQPTILPIELAPKDGTEILLFRVVGGNIISVNLCRWIKVVDHPFWATRYGYFDGPTHWMPKPGIYIPPVFNTTIRPPEDTIEDLEERKRFRDRRLAIFDAGAEAARRPRRKNSITPIFEGRELGSTESITFISGIVSVIPDYIHPFGGLVNPDRSYWEKL